MLKEKINSHKSHAILHVNEDLCLQSYTKQEIRINSKGNEDSELLYNKNEKVHNLVEIKHSNASLTILYEEYLESKPVEDYIFAATRYLESTIPEKFLSTRNNNLDWFNLKPNSEIVNEQDKVEYIKLKKDLCLLQYILQKEQETADLYLSLEENEQANVYINLSSLLNNAKANSDTSYQEKIKFSNLILKYDAKNPIANFYKGESLLKLEKHSEAIEPLQKYLDHNKYCSTTWQSVAECYGSLDKDNDVIEAYRSAIFFSPEDAELLFTLGTGLVLLGRLRESKHLFAKSSKIQPNEIMGKTGNIITSLVEGDFEEALWNLSVLDQDCKTELLTVALSAIEFVEKYPYGLKILDYLITLDKNNASYYENKSIILSKLGNFIDAASNYSTYLDLVSKTNPEDITYEQITTLGLYYKRSGMYKEATGHFESIANIEKYGLKSRMHLFCLYYLEANKEITSIEKHESKNKAVKCSVFVNVRRRWYSFDNFLVV